MIAIIILFGLLTCVAGVIIIYNPEIIFGVIRDNLDKVGLQVVAIILRLVLGILLIEYAPVSRFPLIIEILGWLSIAAALTFMLIGRANFLRLMNWALTLLKPYGRIGGIFAAGFGAFLFYAFI
jgi:hypothetical protein